MKTILVVLLTLLAVFVVGGGITGAVVHFPTPVGRAVAPTCIRADQ